MERSCEERKLKLWTEVGQLFKDWKDVLDNPQLKMEMLIL